MSLIKFQTKEGLLVREKLQAFLKKVLQKSILYGNIKNVLHTGVAQLVEQWTPNPRAPGSSPGTRANFINFPFFYRPVSLVTGFFI